jgi:hypothetical protein
MEGVTRIKCLLGVELYEISNNFIYKMREAHKKPDEVFDYLPTYTLNTYKDQHNRPMLADCFHQFIGLFDNEKNEKYFYFNLETLDSQLKEEIDNAGIEDLFKKFDFLKILSHFTSHSEDDLSKMVFPTVNYLIVELTYDVSYDYYNGGYDCDLDVDIIGYLDGNLQTKYFQNN